MEKKVDFRTKIMDFEAKMRLPYRIKVEYAKLRIKEFIRECDLRELNYYVSVGGLDSITLLCFLRSLHVDCPAISVSHLEDLSIQKIHRELGVECIKPAVKSVTDDGRVTYWNKQTILQEFGFPVVSKDIATRVYCLKHGKSSESGARWRTLPKKWQKLLEAPFEVSDRCCYYLKHSPLLCFERKHNSAPFLGLMASEGGRRAFYLKTNGCNYYGGRTRSAPFAIFGRQDLLQLALDLQVPVPEIYGKIERKDDGTLFTTKAQRTGCEMCGFGAHLAGRPHKFDLLLERNPKAWHFWMYECCTDDDGQKFGWARVLDYIGVEYLPEQKQITLFEERRK